MLLTTQYLPISQPPLIFLTVLLIILFAPIIMGRLRIPHIIGLVLAGVLIGPYGLHVLERDASFSLFGFVGLFYIMFLAGLEMDMEGLRRSRGRVLLFGVLTFLLPFVLTYFMAVELLGYTMWGILDIVSCGPLTMDKRYGVVYVDLDNGGKGTGKRIRKDSFYWYKKCIESNGEDLA